MLSKDDGLKIKQIIATYPNRVWRLPESQRVAFKLSESDREYIKSTIDFMSFRFHSHQAQQITMSYKGYECDAILLPIKRHADLKVLQFNRIQLGEARKEQAIDMMYLCFEQNDVVDWLLIFAISIEYIYFKRKITLKKTLSPIGYPLSVAYTEKYGKNISTIFRV